MGAFTLSTCWQRGELLKCSPAMLHDALPVCPCPVRTSPVRMPRYHAAIVRQAPHSAFPLLSLCPCRRPVVNLVSRMEEGFLDAFTPMKFAAMLYVVTAAAVPGVSVGTGAAYTAGSAVYSLDPVSLQYTLITTLPCCGAVWRSAVFADASGMSRTRFAGDGTPAKTPTGTATASRTPSTSISRSFSATASVSPSFSQTPRPFHMQLVPAGASSASVGAAATATVSPSQAQAVCTGPGGAPCVSKALPPAHFTLVGSGCPAPQASLRCAAAAGSGVIVVPPQQIVACSVVGTVDAPLAATVDIVVDPWASAAVSSADEAMSVRVDCELTAAIDAAGGTKTAPADVTVSLRPHEWPLPLSDVLLYFPDARAVVSTRFRTQAMLPAHNGSTAASLTASACGAASFASTNNASGTSAPPCLGLTEGSRIAEALALPQLRAGAPGEDFSATVAGRATALLIAPWRNGSLVPIFLPAPAVGSAGAAAAGAGTNATQVFVGDRAAAILWVNANGTIAEVALPLLCTTAGGGAATAGCGRQSLTVTSRLTVPKAGTGASGGSTAFNMSCPPFCPGAFDGAFPFVSAPAASSSSTDPLLQLARWPIGATPGTVLPEAVQWSGSSLGLVYAFACPGYTSPHLDGACTNTSHPLFPNCAFGEGAACRRCPANAVCPGGSRMWPAKPGFFVEAESTGVLLRCAAPSTARCIEFDVASGAMRCGDAYAQGSWGCLTCAAGSYPKSDGGCAACPQGRGYTLLAQELGKALGVLLAWAIAVYALLYGVAKALGSSLKGSAMRLLDLLLFAWVLLQTIAAVGTEATAGLPAALQALYAAISALQLRGFGVPAACLVGEGISPFASEIAAFVFVLLALPAVVLLATGAGDRAVKACVEQWHRRCAAGPCARCCSSPVAAGKTSADASASSRDLTDGQKPAGKLGRLRARIWSSGSRFPLGYTLCFALVVLYAYVCKASLALVTCESVTLPLGQAAGLQGADAAALTAAATVQGLVTVRIVTAHPSFLCGAGAHAGPYALAWLVLVAFVIAFPLASALWAWRCKRRASVARRAALLNPVAAFLLTATYRPGAFYVRQLDMVQLAVLSALSTLWTAPASAGAFAGRCVLQCLVLLAMSIAFAYVRPYTAEDSWRLPLRIASFGLGGLVALVGALIGTADLAEADADAAGRSSLERAVQGLAWTLFTCAILYTILLVAAVGRSLITGAKAEATIAALKRKAAAAASGLRTGSRPGSAIEPGPSAGAAFRGTQAKDGSDGGPTNDDDGDDEPLSDWHVGAARGFISSVNQGRPDPARGSGGRSAHLPRPFFAQLELTGSGAGGSAGMSRDAMKALAVYGDPSSAAAATEGKGADGANGVAVPLALRSDFASHAAAESNIASAAAAAGGRGAAFFTVSNPLSAPGVSQAVAEGLSADSGASNIGSHSVGVGIDDITPPRFAAPPPPQAMKASTSYSTGAGGDGDRIRVLPTLSRKKPLSSS